MKKSKMKTTFCENCKRNISDNNFLRHYDRCMTGCYKKNEKKQCRYCEKWCTNLSSHRKYCKNYEDEFSRKCSVCKRMIGKSEFNSHQKWCKNRNIEKGTGKRNREYWKKNESKSWTNFNTIKCKGAIEKIKMEILYEIKYWCDYQMGKGKTYCEQMQRWAVKYVIDKKMKGAKNINRVLLYEQVFNWL